MQERRKGNNNKYNNNYNYNNNNIIAISTTINRIAIITTINRIAISTTTIIIITKTQERRKGRARQSRASVNQQEMSKHNYIII